MKNSPFRMLFLALFWVLLIMPVTNFAQDRPKRPPEYEEYRKALRMPDPESALKELKRIKEKYPNSTMMEQIDRMIATLTAYTGTSVDQVREAQKALIQSAQGIYRIRVYLNSCRQILNNKNVDNFNPDKVLQAILYYSEEGQKIAREEIKATTNSFNMMVASAYILAKNGKEAVELLEKYRDAEGKATGEFYYYLGQAKELLGKKQEAFEAYFKATGEQYKDSQEKARTLFKVINGNMEEFDRMLEAKLSELSFHPEPFKLVEEWNGKTVLAELFTGTECPPCAAADLAFDALLEAYDSKYLAVLEYHLPIPGPDPMMNSATRQRQSFYNVTSTPAAFFDGIMKHRGGGSRADAKRKYDQYISSINEAICSTPKAQLAVSAVLEGDNVKVTWSSDDSLEGIYYNFALVQSEERYLGRSGILIHKMVVRDVKSLTKKFALASEKNSEVIFNVNTTEKYAENLLKDYEKRRRFRFKELRHKIDRTQLKVVFFLQHKDSKIVYNAIVCDVVLK